MVLSNKKLKQKLRAAIAESAIAGTAAEPAGDDVKQGHVDQIESLKRLLSDGGKKRSNFSKREKRRKVLSSDETPKPLEEVDGADGGLGVDELGGTEKKQIKGKSVAGEGRQGGKMENAQGVEGAQSEENGTESIGNKKKKKKRKRGDAESEEGGGVLVGSRKKEEAEKGKIEMQNKEKKKKKRNKNKKQRGKGEEQTETRSGENEIAEFNNADESGDGVSATKVYAGGIPYYSTEDDIKSFFESCGTITEVDCMSFPESGKFRGIAIITFKTEAAAKRALALDGADMGGLFLKIQSYRSTRVQPKLEDFSPKIVEGYNRIYVGNLSWDITEDDLRKFFSDCSISSIRFGMDKETEEFKGYAHVDFSDSDSLVIALSLDQKVVCGRPARIRCAVPKKETKTHANAPRNSFEKESVNVSDNQKKKRRTCYQCGVPGHVSSSCPNQQKDK